MQSRWSDLKSEAVYLRQHGLSITYVESKLGVPKSTLSEWFKPITLTPEQKANLHNRKVESLRAQQHAAQTKATDLLRKQEAAIQAKALQEAQFTLGNIDITRPELQELALAVSYMSGSKGSSTLVVSSDPKVLKFAIATLRRSYNVAPSELECSLRLSSGQDDMQARVFWSDELGIPIENFGSVVTDKRIKTLSKGSSGNGICALHCKNIAIQRKLTTLYNLFCERASSTNPGD